jgi:hypothetical protein
MHWKLENISVSSWEQMRSQWLEEMRVTILCKQEKGNQTCWFLFSFELDHIKVKQIMQRRYHRKCWMQLISCPLDLVGYELCRIMKEVTLSSGLLEALFCGPRVALI